MCEILNYVSTIYSIKLSRNTKSLLGIEEIFFRVLDRYSKKNIEF